MFVHGRQAGGDKVTQSGSREQTLHQRILADIEGRIVSGEWPPGHRIPFEVDLAGRYKCSRMTVNKVMTQLAKAGLIERHRKAGSFVTRPRAQSAVLEIHNIETEVASLGLPYGYELLARAERRANDEDRRQMGLRERDMLVELEALHTAGGRPFCLEQRYINTSAVPEAAAADFNLTPPGQWLIAQVPWSTAENRIQAAGASPEIAHRLAIPKATPCLVVERRTWINANPITLVRLVYPGDSHTLIARFAPAS